METVGKISKTFGTEGELIINLFDTFPDNYNTKEPLFVFIDNLAVPFFADSFKLKGRSSAVVTFADIDSARRAEELIGKTIHLESAETPGDYVEPASEGAVYLEDIAGFAATVDGIGGGLVEEFIDGKNPLFRLSLNGREVLIPAVDEFITELDTDARTISFELPVGLLDMYLE